MKIVDFILQLGEIDLIIDIIKLFFINIYTYYTYKKILYIKNDKKKEGCILILFFIILIISILIGIVRFKFGKLNGIIFMIVILSLVFKIFFRNNLGLAILNIIISIAINYIIFFISILVCFTIYIAINIRNDYISLISIILFYTVLIKFFLKTKRFKRGIVFFRENLNNDYCDILILNLSVNSLALFILLINLDLILKRKIFIVVIIFSAMMFITIYKSLQLNYKQRLVIQDLEETKKELKDKKGEIKELEKEILNFNKMKHTIMHKQKALEYKIEELKLNSEIGAEISIENQLSKLRKEITGNKIQLDIQKTGIEEVDNMLRYMQSECTKNEIEFELQINGNIHQMVNNYISKEKLEILIADHIKNAIIAIQHSKNKYKNILVRIGKIDGYYSLYIYDTGKEFEKETLLRIGKEPITTHKDEGGSGMGFMNTFDTLQEYKASMLIKEIGEPREDNYTKIIMIQFNNKNEFKIDSYRNIA